MAKFKAGDLRLKDGKKISFNLDLDSNLWWDDMAQELRLDTVISGVTPTQDYHLTTKSYVDASGAATLLELTDTPAGYDDGKYLMSTASGTEWSTVSGIDDAILKRHTQNTDTILMKDVSTELINAGYLKSDLIADDDIKITIDKLKSKNISGLEILDSDDNCALKIGRDEYTVGLGVGTNTPDEPLHVSVDFDGNKAIKIENVNSGTSAVARLITKTDDGSFWIASYGSGIVTSGAKKNRGVNLSTTKSGGISIVSGNSDADIRFYTGGKTDSHERMSILSSGAIEISDDLRLQDDKKITFGTSLDSNLWWDSVANDLRLDTTISGVTPTQDYHLATKSYVDDGGGASTLLGLMDTPAGYDEGKYLISTASGTEWATASGGEEASGKTGIETIASGADSVGVTFGSPFDDTNYSIVTSLVNTVDDNPAQYGSTVDSKTINGFTVLLSDFTDTGNYELNWAAWEEASGGGNYDNYSGWSFAVDGVTKDDIVSSGILNFVSGDNITITRSAEDEITISGSSGGAGGATTLLELTDTPAIYDDGKYFRSTSSGTEWGVIAAASTIVTVGTSGADYDNFDDAIDYLANLRGGTIIVTSDMAITSTDIKDITNITIEGDLFYSGTRRITKAVNGGYWYGKNVNFKDIWFYRLADAGANEIFRFTEDYQDVTLNWVNCVGLGATNSPKVFNCNGKEAHVTTRGGSSLGQDAMSWHPFMNPSTLVLHLHDRTVVYLASETIDACWLESSCVIQGTPSFSTPNHPILIDKASGVDNDSSVEGDTVKDALENLTEKNGVSDSFTTNDGKTVTVVDGQITSIV